MGELWPINVRGPADGVLFGNNEDDYEIGAQQVADFTPSVDSADEIIDDPEEAAMLMQWLTSVGTLNSDVFAVYMVVRGYPAGDFDKFTVTNANGVDVARPVEQTRILAILDRSQMRADAGQPKIIAVLRF
jgi:hypothetical protein